MYKKTIISGLLGLIVSLGLNVLAEDITEKKVREIFSEMTKKDSGNGGLFDQSTGEDSPFEIHGHLQFEYEETESDGGRNGNSTFDTQYLTLWFGFEIEDNMNIVAEVEYEHGGTLGQNGGTGGGGSGELEVDQAFFNWDILSDSTLQVKIGKFYVPFGIERFSYAGPSNRLVSRPAAFQKVYPGTYADSGIQTYGSISLSDSNSFKYEAAVVNGLGPDANTSIRDSRQGRDNNDNKAYVGRLAFNSKVSSDLEIEVGGSYYDGKYNEHLGYIAENKLRLTYTGADLRITYNNFDFRAEKIISTVDQGETATNNIRNFRRSGYYTQLAYRQEVDKELIKFVDLVTRFSSKDENSTVSNTADQNQWSVGINWGITDKVIMKVERQFNHERHGNKLSDDAWLGQLSVAF